MYCGPGEEGTDTCAPCKDDFYKSTGGRTACLQCTGHMTSSKNDRTKCTVCKYSLYILVILKIVILNDLFLLGYRQRKCPWKSTHTFMSVNLKHQRGISSFIKVNTDMLNISQRCNFIFC